VVPKLLTKFAIHVKLICDAWQILPILDASSNARCVEPLNLRKANARSNPTKPNSHDFTLHYLTLHNLPLHYPHEFPYHPLHFPLPYDLLPLPDHNGAKADDETLDYAPLKVKPNDTAPSPLVATKFVGRANAVPTIKHKKKGDNPTLFLFLY
jgi:hypothetical protein